MSGERFKKLAICFIKHIGDTMKKHIAIILGLMILFTGCVGQKKEPTKMILASTTSTQDSGLLDYILPVFSEKYNVDVQVVAVGSGQAFEIGKKGDADVLLVHSPADELKFVDEGWGVNRKCVMYNDYVIVGPKEDPAGIAGMKDAVSAFQKMAEMKVTFISRGDNSGTQKKELSIWKKASIAPDKAWYLESGTGMGNTLTMTQEKKAYTITDRATLASMVDKLPDLAIMVEGDKILLNPYGVMAVNPEKFPTINGKDAMNFIEWIMSDEGQDLIASYKKGSQQLFIPLHGNCMT